MFKKTARLGVPLFFVLPIVGFLTALCNIRSKSSAFVYVAFAMLLGYAISFSDTSADSYRYAQAFKVFDNTLDYNDIVRSYQSGELRDIYMLVVFYLVSFVSNNPKVMYAFAGLIYGIFSYLSLKVFVTERGEKWDKYMLILAVIFFTYNSLINVNGFRFNTGAVVLFYSVYNCIIQRKTIWIIGILITPLFHYSFMPIVPVLVLYKFVAPMLYGAKGFMKALFYIFVFAFFVSWILGTNSINLGFLSRVDLVSGAVKQRLDYVNSSDVTSLVESRRSSSLFLSVQKYFDYGIKIYVFIAILFLNGLVKRMKGNKTSYTVFFAFLLFFYAVAFIVSSFPSGARFLNIAHLFFCVFLAKMYFVYEGKGLKRLIIWSLPVFSFSIAFINGLLPVMILTPTFWYGNFFWIIIEGIGFTRYFY